MRQYGEEGCGERGPRKQKKRSFFTEIVPQNGIPSGERVGVHRRSLDSIEPRPACVSLCLCVCRGALIRAKQHLMIMRLGEERKDPGMQ